MTASDDKTLTTQELEITLRTFKWASTTKLIAKECGISPNEFKAHLATIQEKLDAQRQASLTNRETQVLQTVADSASTDEKNVTQVVADTLGISISTVRTHLYRTFKKLGASSRAEAIAIAMREGFIH